MSSTVGDQGQGGRFGAKEVRTRRLLLAAIFYLFQSVDSGMKTMQILQSDV